MKKIKYLTLLFLAVSVGFTSCKKDDDEVSIVGKWGTTKSVNINYTGTIKGSTETETTFTAEDYIEFKSDGTTILSEDGDTDAGTYTFNNDTQKLSIKFTGDDESVVFDIKTLTTTDLVLYTEEIDVEGSTTYKYTSEVSFKRK